MNELKNPIISPTSAEYEGIAHSDEFIELLAEKKRFIAGYSLLYIGYSMLLPILAFYTDILSTRVIGDISVAWIYGVSIIVMCWIVCSVYVRKSAMYDKRMHEIVERSGLN